MDSKIGTVRLCGLKSGSRYAPASMTSVAVGAIAELD